eukprot:scaffold93653_cov27-Tisochrysis_lutea.AAC.2
MHDLAFHPSIDHIPRSRIKDKADRMAARVLSTRPTCSLRAVLMLDRTPSRHHLEPRGALGLPSIPSCPLRRAKPGRRQPCTRN